jgi:hypothetical protein
VPDQTQLAAALLAADADERQRLLVSADHDELERAIVALGQRREPAAAEVLDLIDHVVSARDLRKAARRELHRLRSAGVHVSVQPLAVAPSAQPREPRERVELSQAWASDIDPTGARAVWLLADRALGGAWLAVVILNDLEGLTELDLVETTRKRVLRQLDDQRRDPRAPTWVALPTEYALRLVREGVDLVQERGAALPTKYNAFRDLFGEASEGGPERALIYDTISPLEVSLNPEWLARSPELVGEPELAGWGLHPSEELRKHALEVARAPSSGLVVPGNPFEQQARRLLAEAGRQLVTPAGRRALRRRLEETAYIFAQTDHLPAARLAVAAARALEDTTLAVERHPLVRTLLIAGLVHSVQAESVAGGPASAVLFELLDRSTQETQAGEPLDTTPSGLILPR